MKKSNTITIFVFLLFTCIIAFAQTGKVIWVKDGDTFVLIDDENVKYTIRVADVDSPEKSGGQPFSNKALRFTIKEIHGKTVTVKYKSTHKKRIVGYVSYENKDLGHELLKAGLAWHAKYFSDDEYMAELEQKAKDTKTGLWIDPNPINPYEWRKGKRK